MLPFQGVGGEGHYTQGAALGCVRLALWAGTVGKCIKSSEFGE